MQTQKLLVALAVLALIVCGGVAQGAIEVGVGVGGSNVDAQASAVTFAEPYPTSWVDRVIGTITIPATSGWVDWIVAINSDSYTFRQSVSRVGNTVTLGAVGSKTQYATFSGNPQWEVYIPGGEVTLTDGQTVVPVYGAFKDTVAPPVPEPATLAIWSLLGAVGVCAGYWRTRKTA